MKTLRWLAVAYPVSVLLFSSICLAHPSPGASKGAPQSIEVKTEALDEELVDPAALKPIELQDEKESLVAKYAEDDLVAAADEAQDKEQINVKEEVEPHAADLVEMASPAKVEEVVASLEEAPSKELQNGDEELNPEKLSEEHLCDHSEDTLPKQSVSIELIQDSAAAKNLESEISAEEDPSLPGDEEEVATPSLRRDPLDQSPRSLVYPADANMPRAERIVPISGGSNFMMRSGPCDPASLSLSIRFSDYTIDQNGAIQRDGGWTAAERELYSGFLCNMMPILEELYGAPFEQYPLTLVRDFYNTASSMFIPAEKSIRTHPSWNPQLLTHELVHAFRGDWTLTTANNRARYTPKLSGYEEGFAQAVSYDAMNMYLDTYGSDRFIGARWNRVWASESEWNYDFKNDSSMITEDFWSDIGGTRKYYERYEQAAAALKKLAVRIPNFYRRFNEGYYQQIRSTPGYLPSKQRIDALIQSLTDAPITSWISKQNILQCRVEPGKKVWMTNSQSSPTDPLFKVHFLETFPNGSEWYYTVPGQGYLLHRLNGTAGSMQIVGAWDNDVVVPNQSIMMKNDPRWQLSDPICYLNCSYGFGAEQVLISSQNVSVPQSLFAPVQQPELSGLYQMNVSYQNPNFRTPALYGISYDAQQREARETFYQILGVSSAEFAANRLFGGVVGLPGGSGTVTISRDDSPESITVPVVRGLFQTPGAPSWFTTIRDGAFRVSRPGTLNFEIRDESGNVISEQRDIGYGNYGGKHQFLFTLPCSGDFNRDGATNQDDVSAFFAQWEAGESIADINQDGGVDGQDVSSFFERYESGDCHLS